MFKKPMIAFDPNEDLDPRITPPPLADPVFGAIFQNVEVSGLAMQEFLNAALTDSGDPTVSNILTITPQAIHAMTSHRGYRIDVEVKTASGEIALVEVQLASFRSMIERDLLYAEQSMASDLKRGDPLSSLAERMPRVIMINLLNFILRPTGKNFHQVVELMYREAPPERATDKLQIHTIQLPMFQILQPNFNNKLHCWLSAICQAHELRIPLKEVVKMSAALTDFYQDNPGFAQFTDRHGAVTANPEMRKEYRRWEYERLLNGLEADRLKQEGIQQGRHEGIQQGRQEGIQQGRQEGIQEWFLESLPFYFRTIKADPQMWSKVHAMGATAGVNKQTIQQYWEQWQASEGEKETQP